MIWNAIWLLVGVLLGTVATAMLLIYAVVRAEQEGE